MSHLPPEILDNLAEGETPSPEQKSHLESCPECGRKLEESRRYFLAMKSLPQLRAPAGFSLRLRQRLEAESAVPGWRRFFSAFLSPRRIPLQLAGAGFAALLLFWALPRYQSTPPGPETGVEKKTPSPPPAVEVTTLDATQPAAAEKDVEAKKLLAPEPPKPALPRDLQAGGAGKADKKSVAVRGRVLGKSDGEQASPLRSKSEDLAMIEVKEAPARPSAKPGPHQPAKPAAVLGAAPAEMKKRTAPAEKAELAESESPAAPAATQSARGAEDSYSRSAEAEAPAATSAPRPEPSVASPPPSTNSLLRAFGFRPEIRKGRWVHILRLSKAESDTTVAKLKSQGLEKLLILHALPGDSLEIEIR